MPPAKIPSIGLGKKLRFAHMAFSRALRLELGREGISFGQFVHLESLWNEDGITQTELSARVGVETASSTAILEELEKLKLVKRSRDACDRRKRNVFLTPAGRNLNVRLLKCAKGVNEAAKLGLSDAELQTAFNVLDRLQVNLTRAFPANDGTDSKSRLRS